MRSHYKIRIYYFFVLLILTLTIATDPSLSAATEISTNDLSIVVSLSLIEEWTKSVTGDLFDVTTIVTGLENPHTYDPTPSEIATIVGADLFIRFGNPGLEPWVQAILNSNPTLAGKTLTLVDYNKDEYMDYDPLIEAKNSHVWMSPVKARNMTTKIYNKLVAIDNDNNETFYNNLIKYEGELFNLLERMDQAKQELRGTKVIVHHPSFIYFFDLLGIERLASIEEHEGSEPSATHIAEITTKIKDELKQGSNVLLINQPQLEEDDVVSIAEETGINIAVLTPLLGVEVEESLQSKFGTTIDGYIEMFDYNLFQLKNTNHEGTTNTSTQKNTPGLTFIGLILGFVTLTLTFSKKK